MSSTAPQGARFVQHEAGMMETLDARGLLCPLPVIRTQDRMRDLAAGTTLEVLATDPGVLEDIPAWCRVHGHEVVSSEEDNDVVRVVVRKMHQSGAGEEAR